MGLKAVVVIIVVIALIILGVQGYLHWEASIQNQVSIKVSQVNYGYDVFSGSHTTEVLGFDGRENLLFWDNQTGLFLPNHSYLVVYYADYRGIWPVCGYTIVSIAQINDTP
jgi:hypothetical protein